MAGGTETITLKLIAQDMMSGNITKAISGMDSLAKRGGLVGSVFQGVGQSFGQMLNPVGLLTRGVGMVTDALGDAVQAAIEDEKATAQLTQTIDANVKAWDGNLDAVNAAIDAGAQLAFTDDEVRSGLNQLIPRTKDIAKANELNALAMDLARAKGLGLEEAATLVGKAFSGQASALKRAGINIKDTKNSTAALAELQRTVSGQAKTYANTTEGAMKRVDIQTSEAMESIGYAIKPVVGAFLGFAADVIPEVISAIGNLGTAFDNLHAFLDPTYGGLREVEKAIRAKAQAEGVDADAVIEWTKAQEAAIRAEKDRADSAFLAEAEIQALLSAQRDSLVRRIDDQDEINRQMAEYEAVLRGVEQAQSDLVPTTTAMDSANLRAQDTIDTYWNALDNVIEKWEELGDNAEYGSAAWSEQNRMMADNAVLLRGAFKDLPKSLQDALVEAGIVVKGAGEELAVDDAPAKKSIRSIVHAYSGGVVDMAKTIEGGSGRIIEAFRDLAWQSKHPFAVTNYEDWLRSRAKQAMRKMEKAAKDGRPDLVEQYRILYSEIVGELEGLPGYAATITQRILAALDPAVKMGFTWADPGTWAPDGNPSVPNPKKKPRNKKADGGAVYPWQAYTVGEAGEETLVMGRSGGYVIPADAGRQGRGGGVTVNLHWQSLVMPTEAEADRIAARLGPAIERRMARVGA